MMDDHPHETTTTPGSIRVAIVTEGTRGDIQPHLALALRLRDRGNVVKIFTNSNYTSFCGSFGIPASGVFYDASKEFEAPAMKKAFSDGDSLAMAKVLKEVQWSNMAEDLKRLFDGLDAFAPTLILPTFLARFKCLLYSFTKTVPTFIVDLQMFLPVSDAAPVGLPSLPFGMNILWWKLILSTGDAKYLRMKDVAREVLGIEADGKFEPPIHEAMTADVPAFPAPVCYAISTLVIPEHPEWPKENLYVCGFFTMDAEDQRLKMDRGGGGADAAAVGGDDDDEAAAVFGTGADATALSEFLSEGPPPVYLGWGSMICKSPGFMVTLAVEALKHAGARGIVLGGWAGLSRDHAPPHLREFCDSNVLFVERAPHEWLFPRCSCIVHHGGSGTTAASVRSGKPTIITPVCADQYDFAAGVRAVGCGIDLGRLGKVTGTALGDAIVRCRDDEALREKAASVGADLRAEDGCGVFLGVLDRWIAEELVPGVWRRKHEALLRRCEEARRARSEARCAVS
mmetsp:Transcript_23360/g.55287  ORF Transcript_23360/g.55287 Transcript_23360/m.55287 type:complete len:512 (-) Transcript_23360:423-1958(-)